MRCIFRKLGCGLLISGLAIGWLTGETAQSQTPTAQIIATATLPDLPIAPMQNAALPGSISNDRGLLLGGIGSDIWRDRADPPNQFYLITDRGPNGQIRVDGRNRRTFPIPEYAPHLLQAQISGANLEIIKATPIVGQSGRPANGLSNQKSRDEIGYDYTAQVELPFDPNGLDTEGMARTRAGDFWVAEEYSPSILKIDANGVVQKRFTPSGVNLTGTDYPVIEALPPIYAKRKINRGFEGLALSGDERTALIVLQSPLMNPDRDTGDKSRNTRILAFDTVTEQPVSEWVYRLEPVDDFDPNQKGKPDEMKLSAIVWLNPTQLLVLERTDDVAKVYLVDTAPAMNILGTRWSDPATTPTLESLTDPAAAGVAVLPKRLIVDLSALPGMPGKIEGVAVVDATTIAVANDNDFDVNTFDANGNHVPAGAKSQLLLVRLSEPLPLAAPN